MAFTHIQIEAERVLKHQLAPILPYMEDSNVNEVMLNSQGNYFVEHHGVMERIDIQLDEYAIESSIHAVMSINDKVVSYIMDARLPGFRVACALPPVSVHGPMMTIRKHASRKIALSEYVETGAFNKQAKSDIRILMDASQEKEALAKQGGEGLSEFLSWAVNAHKNILVVGGTSSGKTTLLMALLQTIGNQERIITCEDTNELHLTQPNIVQLEAFAPPGGTAITIRDLIRLCLRSRPDRLIVGEIRGPEAYDLLDAMNTGHSGSICSLHADSAAQGLSRLESLIRMSPSAANLPLKDMRAEIARAIDYVIFQSRAGGMRAPEEVIAIEKNLSEDGEYCFRQVFSKFY